MAVRASGQVTRSPAADVPAKGRDTMGVKFVTVADDDSVVAIARNTEREVDEELLDGDAEGTPEGDDGGVRRRSGSTGGSGYGDSRRDGRGNPGGWVCMSNPRDDGPLAPRRPLSKAGAPAPAGANGASSRCPELRHRRQLRAAAPGVSPSVSHVQPCHRRPDQPVMTPPYGGNPQPYSAVEVEPGRTFPVPPAPGDQGDHRDDGTASAEGRQARAAAPSAAPRPAGRARCAGPSCG